MPARGLRSALEARLLRLWYDHPQDAAARAAHASARVALSPLSTLVAAVAAHRRRRIDRRGDRGRPAVVVVGNLIVGGAGKTPVVIALVEALRARGRTPGVLARGYRSAGSNARLVEPDSSVAEVGDEPLLLARATGAPVAVGVDRAAALALLRSRAPEVDVVVCDDGLQHVGLPRDIEVAVFDARGAGNGRVLPAGPLREPLETLRTMDAVLLNGAREAPVPHPHVFGTRIVAAGWRPVGRAAGRRPADVETVARFAARARGLRAVALAGIGAPQRFFGLVAACGVECTGTIALPDHVGPTAAELSGLKADLVLMTEKDAVKCEDFADARCWALQIRAELEPGFVDFIAHRLCMTAEG